MDIVSLRAWWAHRQGLDGSLANATGAEVLSRTGWARSVGGAAPYLTLFGRAGLSRRSVDDAVAALEIHELPAARGCTYVVPAADFALALKLSQGRGDSPDVATAKKYCGVSEVELGQLSTAVLDAVSKQPLDPRELKTIVGAAARNLGAEGKKRGVTTTLPLVLGRLQGQGEIRRVPIDGRLDRQRYRYVRWSENPLKGYTATLDEAYTSLAERYFRWIGPASPENFQWFSGLGVKAAAAAIAPLNLTPMAAGDERLLFRDDLEKLRAFKLPSKPQVALVGSLDGISLLRRDLASLVDPADAGKEIPDDNGCRAVGAVADLTCHAILDRGRLIGVWEYDSAKHEVVWATFTKALVGLKKVVALMETFVRDELGDARSFSLDSPESRTPRLAALRNPAW